MTTDPLVTDQADENLFLSITERDIDLLVLEEFHVNPGFTAWFARQCLPSVQTIEFIGAWHSLVDSVYGESDLTLIVKADNCAAAILIEDKIDAITMPEQANRYKRRGNKGVADGKWESFTTCMIAPKRYLEHLPPEEKYETYLSYETLADWFMSSDSVILTPQRCEYRAKFITSAIEKQRRTETVPRDPLVEEFLNHYCEFVRDKYPALPAPRIIGNWATYNLIPLADGMGVSIHHKLTQGLVELEFQCGLEHHVMLMHRFSALQRRERQFKRYSKYLGLRQMTGRLDIGSDFETAITDVDSALSAVAAIMQDFNEAIASE